MNVFEDLIEELKDEKLLEDTILELQAKRANPLPVEPAKATPVATQLLSLEQNPDQPLPSQPLEQRLVEEPKVAAPESEDYELPLIEKAADGREFFRKRAMEEVSSLQMVEHVLSGVEREHMKMPSAAHDDLEVKKALHRFLQVTGDTKSEEHAEAEHKLMHETEIWCSALAGRDSNISVANIRRFCENSRPVLSSQALIALARFYRNSPFSELTRGKFDLVITKLFSREMGEQKRKLLFGRPDMIVHINTLYANWSSLSLYASDDDAPMVKENVAKFTEFVREAETTRTLDDLVAKDLFERIRVTKESLADMFYAPEITAAAIDCNVRLGNKFVELVYQERENESVESIEEKYGYTYDQIISNAAGKTLHLVDLLKSKRENTEVEEEVVEEEIHRTPQRVPVTIPDPYGTGSRRFEMFGVNKWLLATTLLIAAISIGLYVWADKFAASDAVTTTAKQIDISRSDIKEYFHTARGTSETFYGVTHASWDQMTDPEKKDVLQKALKFANENGFKKVIIVNVKGRTVGYASKDRAEILNQ